MRMILPLSVVALTVLGGGLLHSSSIAASRQQPGADGTAADVFTDYADETTGTITRVFPGSERSYNFLQATGFREGRSVVAQLTPIDTFEPSDADDEISLPTGDIVITQPYIRISPNAYTISYRFHVPKDVLPAEYQHLASAPTLAA